MNTTVPFPSPCRLALALAGASLLGLPGARGADAPKAKEPVYENYVDFAAGYTLQNGDRPGFQKRFQLSKPGAVGIEDMFYTRELNDDTTLTLRGHALAGNDDYLLDLAIVRNEIGYLKLGYKQFRTWYDGSGGYWLPKALTFALYDEDLHVDRSNLWFEAGTTKPGAINFMVRYDLTTRTGTKDSTSWMDTGLAINTANARNIVPTFLRFDETRHSLNSEMSRSTAKTDWTLGLRYDKGDYENGRYSRRTPGQSTNRYVTAKEGQDYDLTQVRGSYVNDLTEKVKLTTAVARTTIDTVLSGSRIFGTAYDADYTSNFPTRQQRDEGFFGLLPGNELGESQMRQTVGTLSLLYLPTAKWRITPSARFEKTSWHNEIEFEETNFGAGPAFAPINEEVGADSEKAWKTYAATLDTRYTGVKNVALNFKADWSHSEGELIEQRILEPGTTHQVISIDRATDLERGNQKYSATASWYVRPGTTVAVQYYQRFRQNDYRASRDNTVSSADRYPAYVANQDLETDDLNVRLTWRVSPTLRTVTRYDYQETTTRTQDIGLAMGESMNNTQHILSESVTWNPRPRWYLQGNVNYVYDTLKTPAATLTGAAAGLVKNSDANYLNVSVSSGYALDEQSDLLVDCMLYRALDNFVDNSARSVPFGTDSELQTYSAAWVRKMNSRTKLHLKYTYARNEDTPSGGTANYEAHLLYGKVQYRF